VAQQHRHAAGERRRLVRQAGAHVFLEPEVAGFLGDKVLDANLESGGQVRFSVLEPGEAEPGGPPA
jgi:hypothetical protein